MSTSQELPKDEYGHLNPQDGITMELSMDELATQIVEKNYGAIRFIHALLRAMKASPKRQKRGTDKLLSLLIGIINENPDLY